MYNQSQKEEFTEILVCTDEARIIIIWWKIKVRKLKE
jgi:hypothetical protein